MKLAVVTLFPEMFAAITEFGVTGRAFATGLAELTTFNPRTYTDDVHQTVDGRPYGGGPGMVMMIEPLRAAIRAAREWCQNECKVVYLSPQGHLLNHQAVRDFSAGGGALVLVAGRYEGIDERLISLEVDEEWSIGDYVLSGGELPAMVLIDALLRQLPGVLGHGDSAQQDSFAGGMLDCPHYTRPAQYQGLSVPEVLLSGDHERIRRWRLRCSVERTLERRPELLSGVTLSEKRRLVLESLRDERD